MKLHYYPETDSLYVEFKARPVLKQERYRTG